MDEGTTVIGLDVHKRSIAVAIRRPGRSDVDEEQLPNEAEAVKRSAKRWKRESRGRLICAYEAGACGYTLQRQLEALGISCQVVAPSLVPRKPGERIKTDRRDARKLAKYLASGDLTAVRPPTPAEEAARDLCRAREDAKQDRMRCRHRLAKFLLRRGLSYPAGRKHWTAAHRTWMETLSFESCWEQVVFDEYRLAVAQLDARLDALDRQIEQLAQSPEYGQRVGALRCYRGIDTRTAVGLVTELHGVERFGSARALMAFVGLVPDEHSSGDRRRRGAITKAGNSHVRRLLIEATWHARHKAVIPVALRLRRQGQPAEIVAMADVASTRLHRRYWRLVQRGKPPTVAVTAVARELTGFVWAALRTRS
jgi:transposase